MARSCAVLFRLSLSYQVRQGARAAGDAPHADNAGRPLLLLLARGLRQWCTQKARHLSRTAQEQPPPPAAANATRTLGWTSAASSTITSPVAARLREGRRKWVRARCAECACAVRVLHARASARVRKRARASAGWGRAFCARLFWYLARAPGPPNFLGSQRRGSATSSERSYASSTSLMSLFSCSPMSAWARGAREIGDERGRRRVRRVEIYPG